MSLRLLIPLMLLVPALVFSSVAAKPPDLPQQVLVDCADQCPAQGHSVCGDNSKADDDKPKCGCATCSCCGCAGAEAITKDDEGASQCACETCSCCGCCK